MISFIVILFFFFLLSKKGTRFTFPIIFAFFLASVKIPLTGVVDADTVLLWMTLLFSQKKVYHNTEKYPFYICSLLFVLSYFLSSYFAKGNPHWGSTFSDLTQLLLLPYIFFINVIDQRDVLRIYKCIIFVIMLLSCVSIVEFALGVNFWQKMMSALLGQYGWNMDGRMRYGMNRLQSIYLHSTALGYISTVLSIFFVLFVINRCPKRFKVMNIYAIIFLFSCSFLSGSRASIIPIPICLAYYFRKKWLRPNIFFPLLIIIPVVVYVWGGYFYDIYNSIVNTDSTMGSSSEMRVAQFEIALRYWQMNPLLGWGNGAIFDIIRNRYGEAILGAESIWLPLLVDLGLFGCFCYLFAYYSSLKVLIGKKKDAVVFLSMILFMNTLTSTPGFDFGIVMCLILLIRRMQMINQNGEFR